MKKILLTAGLICINIFFSFAQQSSWKTENGWALRKEPTSSEYKRFFAIGLWNIPGYQFQAMDTEGEVYRKSSRPYLNKSNLYNMVFMNPGNDKDTQSRIEILGSIPFYNTLMKYQRNLCPVDSNWQYKVRRYMQENPHDKNFEKAFDTIIDSIISRGGNVDHIWAPIDEIVQGGSGADWTWYPQTGEKIKERIKLKEKSTLIYTDLVGVARGNYYLFEKNYLKTHASMPETPPFEALGKDAKILQKRPTLGFCQGYDGTPAYKNGTEEYSDLDLNTLKDLFYNNMKITAHDYKNCGDVFGLNAFYDCDIYPILAGIAVDGIKAGVGDEIPVWLFFDGNGYAKPEGESTSYFVQNLKCQIYTSIIHGATGIMFWNDRDKPADIFNELEHVINELTNQLSILYMDTETNFFENDLHYMIKSDGKQRYIIASNSSKSTIEKLNIPNVIYRELQPLEVFVAPIF